MIEGWRALGRGRVNPLAPGAVVLAGLIVSAVGPPMLGLGIVVGALLALVNGLMLSRRVDFAAGVGDTGTALLVMQLGLLGTFAVAGVAAALLILVSIQAGIGAAIGFGVAQMAVLAVFYFSQGRSTSGYERKARS
ncbi:MAG TPA: hypothetical protein VFA78_07595 [Chloroflexota bacterium]|nr:hypothetical protein [Chloroflexota bacterium]